MNLAGIQISLLTPPGRGAVASIVVAGQGAVELAGRCFSPASGKSLAELPEGRVVFGTIQSLQDATEEVVVGLYGPEHVEIHCHGGALAAAAVMKALAKVGANVIPWQQVAELLETDRFAAEARIALAAARTEKTAAILLDQYHGALRTSIGEATTAIESGRETCENSLARVERLLATASLGKHLTEPWRVVIAGEPNVGKSSLMNALVGYQRSIVFDQPGTTRDLLTASTALDGWPIQLTDTAGLRASDDPLEAAGVARAGSGLSRADLVLWVRDATKGDDQDSSPFAVRIPSETSTLIVRNKADLLPGEIDSPSGDNVFTSALTGYGMTQLCEQIVGRLVPKPPERGEAVVFTPRQAHAVRMAIDALRAGNPNGAVAALQSL
jgi:tRNA modification GTPase